MKIIFATTGAGKSFLAQQYPERFIDGDKLVSWPRRDKWWEKPTKVEIMQVEQHVGLLLSHLGSNASSKIILYNPRVEALRLYADEVAAKMESGQIKLWKLDERALRVNLKRREEAYRAKQPTLSQPTLFADAWNHQQRMVDFFKKYDQNAIIQDINNEIVVTSSHE
jgi:hypothetical protein